MFTQQGVITYKKKNGNLRLERLVFHEKYLAHKPHWKEI